MSHQQVGAVNFLIEWHPRCAVVSASPDASRYWLDCMDLTQTSLGRASKGTMLTRMYFSIVQPRPITPVWCPTLNISHPLVQMSQGTLKRVHTPMQRFVTFSLDSPSSNYTLVETCCSCLRQVVDSLILMLKKMYSC